MDQRIRLGGAARAWALWSTIHRIPHHGSIWVATCPTSDGGPTPAGAWAYHAGAFVVTIFPLLAWMIRGLTRLQAWAPGLGDPGPAGQPATSPG